MSETSSHTLTEEEFRNICEFSASGALEKILQVLERAENERNFTAGPKTFCPDPKEQKPTPIVLSAQYGNKHVVEYFLKKYSDIIDINHVATIVSLITQKKVHCATALLGSK